MNASGVSTWHDPVKNLVGWATMHWKVSYLHTDPDLAL